MQNSKLVLLQAIVSSANWRCMLSKKARRSFAKRIARECNLWEPSVLSFVEEMHGLNFKLIEDRQTFIQFAEVGL